MDQREQPSSGFPSAAEPDPEWREYQAWQDRELAAGRDPDFGREPEVWELGDWDAWDPAASAAWVTALAPPGAPVPTTPPVSAQPVRAVPPMAPAGPSSPVASIPHSVVTSPKTSAPLTRSAQSAESACAGFV